MLLTLTEWIPGNIFKRNVIPLQKELGPFLEGIYWKGIIFRKKNQGNPIPLQKELGHYRKNLVLF